MIGSETLGKEKVRLASISVDEVDDDLRVI
jgi:hypothetical protein